MTLEENTAQGGQIEALLLPNLPTVWCRFWHSILNPQLKSLKHGGILIRLPSGGTLYFGEKKYTTAPVTIHVHRHQVLTKVMWGGPLGLAESNLAGDWSCDNLTALFDLFLKNRTILEDMEAKGGWTKWRSRLRHLSRANSLKGSRRNIAYHYDLGNDFYQSWLDPTMTYSSAYQLEKYESLEQAQRRKYQTILDWSETGPDDHILEIGCGWGGFAEHACQNGRKVEALTLSQEQLLFARERSQEKGFAAKADFRFLDYRKAEGQFDAIVSIEMIEAVGEENWSHYFQILHDRLKPGGHAVLQAITIDEKLFNTYRKSVDFIQAYIFPGGMLPTASSIGEIAEKQGLKLVRQDRFGKDYAKTLEFWRDAFLENWSSIEKLGFDSRFKRMWLYYLCYCEAGFANGDIDVGFYKLRRAK